MKRLLFITPSCPLCPSAKHALDQASLTYECIDATKYPKLVRKYMVMKAPTLIIDTHSSYESYYGIDEIQKYIHIQKVDELI